MTHKEKLIELYTIAVKKYKEAEEGVIWEYSGRIGEDLADLEIEVQKMIEKFSKTLQELDAVEIVRCKDCKYYREGKYFENIKFCFRLKHGEEHVGYNFSEDDFCSHAERR